MIHFMLLGKAKELAFMAWLEKLTGHVLVQYQPGKFSKN